MFRAGEYRMPLGEKTYIMGILNYTPDSFSDGGMYNTPEKALAHALEMQALGADIIDLGANSTRPNARVLSADDEKERLIPALEALSGKLSVPVSVDTFYPECALTALEYGASAINDVSGKFNTGIAENAKKYGAGYIVTHNPCGPEQTAEYKDGVVQAVRSFFLFCINLAAECGLPLEQLCLDVGLGFGKSRENDIELLSELEWLKFRDIALLVGGSRKRFIGVYGKEKTASRRDFGTVAAHTAAIAGGADIIRVHDVYSAVQGAGVADAIYRR